MKTLYISDLDGTLLNHQAELSTYTVRTLNRLIDQGLYFSVATARTAATVLKMLAGVRINMPIVLLNGVCIYDIGKSEYVKIDALSTTAKKEMFKSIRKHNLAGFLYAISGNQLHTYYERADSPQVKAFIAERVRKFNKVFTQVNDFAECPSGDLVNFSAFDTYERLVAAYTELTTVQDLHLEFFRDIYQGDFWYLEASAGCASKQSAVRFLREAYGFERIIGFGDNLNDLPLFDACDASYAVENARPELKARATMVIAANQADGVARWLETNAGDIIHLPEKSLRMV